MAAIRFCTECYLDVDLIQAFRRAAMVCDFGLNKKQ